MPVTLSPFAGAAQQFFDGNGTPLVGGKIYSYSAGTTTPLAAYTSISGTVAHTNPIILDSTGRVPGGEIWLTVGVGYKFVIATASDILIGTYDNIPSAAVPPAANDANSIMYEQGYTVAAGNFVVGNTYRIVSVGSTDFTLIGAPLNAAGVHFIATGVGAGTGTAELSHTVEAKLRQTVHIDDFDGDIEAAVNSLPTEGGVIFFGADTYVSPYQGTYFGNPSILTKKHVTFQGAGKPTFNSTYSALEGGTIIQGSLFFAADGMEFADLGLDVGEDFCVANYAGAPQEGLVGIDRQEAGVPGFAGGDPSKYGFTARNISILCHKTGKPGNTSDVHALLLENYIGWNISNIAHVMGGAGLVIKSSHGTMDGAYCRGSYKYAVLNKSEDYSAASFNTFSNIIIENLLDATPDPGVSADYDTTGIVIEASSANAEMVTVNGLIANGTINGVIVRGLSTFEVQNCIVADGQFLNTDSYVAFTDGITRNVIFDDMQSRNSSHGIYVQSSSDSTGISNCFIEDVTGGYPYRSDAPNTRLISCASTDPVAEHIYIGGGATYVMGDFRAVGGTGLYLVGAGDIYGAEDYTMSTTSTGQPAFLIGPLSGAMAAGDFTSLGLKVRNSAGGAVASGDGIGVEFEAYQPGTGVNQAGLDIMTRPSSLALQRAARFDEQGNAYFRVNQTGSGAAPSLFQNQQISFELVNNTTLKIYMRGTDGVTRSVNLTVS